MYKFAILAALLFVSFGFTSAFADETLDTDNDGLFNYNEINSHGTDPLVADTDADGLSDGAEVNTHTTAPLVADTDGGGVNDGDEIISGLDPLKWSDDKFFE